MKKKMLILLTLVLSVMMALSGCGRDDFEKSIKDPFVKAPALTTQTSTAFFGAEATVVSDASADGRLIRFTNTNALEGETYIALYDVKEGTIIKSFTKPTMSTIPTTYVVNSVGFLENFEKTYGYAVSSVTMRISDVTLGTYAPESYDLTLYNFDGSSFAYESSEDSVPSLDMVGTNVIFGEDNLVFNYKVNKQKVGSFVADTSFGKFKPVPSIDVETEKYLYEYKDDDKVAVYDQKFKKLGVYEAPRVDEPMSIQILANGNLFFQGYNILSSVDKEYDILIDGTKIDLITEVYNVKKDKTEKVDTDYIVSSIINKINAHAVNDSLFGQYEEYILETLDMYEDIDNVVPAVKIENKRVRFMNSTDYELCVINNDGEIEDTLPHVISDQFIITTSDEFGAYGMKDRYYAIEKFTSLSNANVYIVNGDGKVLGQTTVRANNNASYFVANGEIYDKDLGFVYDYSGDTEYALSGYGVNNIYFTRNITDVATPYVKYFRFSNGQMLEICATPTGALVDFGAQYYIVYTNETYYMYNEDGVVLFSSDTPINIAYEDENFKFVIAYTASNIYKVTP